METEVLNTLLESWPQGVSIIIMVYFANKFFGWMAPIVELYVRAQIQWGETSTRTLAEMNELMRIVDARLAAIESHMMGVDSELRPRPTLKKPS